MLAPSCSAARALQRPGAPPPFSSASSSPFSSSSLSRSPRRRLRPRPRPPSAFADDPASLLSNLVDGVLVSAVVGGILLSALPLYSESAGRAAKRRARSKRALAARSAEEEKALLSSSKSSSRTEKKLFEAEAELEEEEGLKWGLATFVACLPLVGFTAWAFAAVAEAASNASSSSSRAPLYWAFAGIYALASLRHGLSLDAESVAVALACAAHVQVERASSTFALGSSSSSLFGREKYDEEEEDFEELFGRKTPAQAAAEKTARAAARAAGAAADSAAAVARAVRVGLEEEEEGEVAENGNRRALPADTRRRAPTREELADRKYDKDLLRSFDERLRERETERKEETREEERR